MPSFLRRIVSMPNNVDHAAAASSEESRPEALPSRLAKKFGNGPALGTVVVDENFPGLAELESKMSQSIFELVEPQVTPSPSSSSSTPSSSSVGKSGAPQRRRIVRQGGLVLFSSAYLKSHPNSAAARLAKSYEKTYAYNCVQQKEEIEAEPEAPAATATAQEQADAAKLATVQREVYAAELGCAPLFRYRADDDVYGRACYLRRDASTSTSRTAAVSSRTTVRPQLARTTYSSSSSLSDGEESVTEHIVASPTSPAGKQSFPEIHGNSAAAHVQSVAMTA